MSVSVHVLGNARVWPEEEDFILTKKQEWLWCRRRQGRMRLNSFFNSRQYLKKIQVWEKKKKLHSNHFPFLDKNKSKNHSVPLLDLFASGPPLKEPSFFLWFSILHFWMCFKVELIKNTVGGQLLCSHSTDHRNFFNPKSFWNLRQVHKGTAAWNRLHKSRQRPSKGSCSRPTKRPKNKHSQTEWLQIFLETFWRWKRSRSQFQQRWDRQQLKIS